MESNRTPDLPPPRRGDEPEATDSTRSRGDVDHLGPGPEQYKTRNEMAQLMRVSVRTIDNMVREGMPSVTWGRRTRRFPPSAAIDWAKKRRRK